MPVFFVITVLINAGLQCLILNATESICPGPSAVFVTPARATSTPIARKGVTNRQLAAFSQPLVSTGFESNEPTALSRKT